MASRLAQCLWIIVAAAVGSWLFWIWLGGLFLTWVAVLGGFALLFCILALAGQLTLESWEGFWERISGVCAVLFWWW